MDWKHANGRRKNKQRNMNPLLLSLKEGAKTYGELKHIPNVDSLLRLALRRREVIQDHEGGLCRFRLFVRPKDQPERSVVQKQKKTMTLEQVRERKRLIDSKRVKCPSCKARFARARFVEDGKQYRDCRRCRILLREAA